MTSMMNTEKVASSDYSSAYSSTSNVKGSGGASKWGFSGSADYSRTEMEAFAVSGS